MWGIYEVPTKIEMQGSVCVCACNYTESCESYVKACFDQLVSSLICTLPLSLKGKKKLYLLRIHENT